MLRLFTDPGNPGNALQTALWCNNSVGKGSHKKKSVFLLDIVQKWPSPPPLPSFWTPVRWLLYRPILDIREVTFLKVQNSSIYPIFRQKVPQNFWNMVIPPPPPPPIYCPKESQNRRKQNYLKTFGFRLNPPPFWTMSKRKTLFFMSSLSEYPEPWLQTSGSLS